MCASYSYRRVGSQLVGISLLGLAFNCAASSRASAADVALSGGTLDASFEISQSSTVTLSGDRGFTFSGRTSFGVFRPWEDCYLAGPVPCGPGDYVSLYGNWSGGDVSGTATLDGITYRQVGSANGPSLTIEFSGSVRLPSLSRSATVVAPLLFDGRFFVPGGVVTLAGSGMATVSLVPDPSIGGRWRIASLHYELGPALPAPWVSFDVGAGGAAGRSSAVDATIVVAGDGSDIWGTSDTFRFVHQSVSGDVSVSAHIVTEQRVYPTTLHASTKLDVFAKSGIMLRDSLSPSAPSVVLDVKPNGELEFMARYATAEPTIYLGGAFAGSTDVWLSLKRTGMQVAAAYSADGSSWIDIGATTLQFQSSDFLGGIAVTSHDPATLNGVLIRSASVTSQANLLTRGDFEDYDPSALGPPGWISDHLLRQVPAKSETHQPHSGLKNGACWTPEYLDCGIYQEISAPASGTYVFRIYATADRSGGLVGANVNGLTAASSDVTSAAFGDYSLYTMRFTASANDVIRVWMYSPAVPGYVVIDDASLTLDVGSGW